MVFPSRAELAAIPSKAAAPEAFGKDDVAVESWTFEAQVVSDAAAYDDPSPWGGVAHELVKGHEASAVLSPALRCAAQEMARFHAKNGAMPTESLRRFMAARCGAVTTELWPVYVTLTSPTPMPDEELASKALAGFQQRLGARLASGHRLLGVGAAREGQRQSVVALAGADLVRLESTSLAVDANRRVELKGAVRGDFGNVGAMINRGDYGTAPCESDPLVAAPAFAVTCELGPGEPFAWVEILARKPGQLLVHEVAEAIVHEGDGSAIAYTAHHAGAPAPVAGAADFSRALVDRLNGVRAAAQIPPLAVATKQAVENARLAGTLIDAGMGGDDATAERAAIGLLAGWDVPGLIRDGRFFMAALGGTSDATAWLDYALERPIGRSALLDPSSRLVAVGPAIPPGGAALGAAVTTYALFESPDHAAEASRFFDRIVATRAARGLSPAMRVQGIRELDVALAHVFKGDASPGEALDKTLQVVVYRTQHSARALAFETNDLDAAPLPAELMAPGPLHLMIGVTHHRAAGAAWGQYVVFMVILEESQVVQTASAR
jgi:hypothetical protein